MMKDHSKRVSIFFLAVVFSTAISAADSTHVPPGRFLFLGNTTPGGVLARRHRKRVEDAIVFASRHLRADYAKACFAGGSKNMPIVLEPALRVGVEDLVGRVAGASSALAGIGYLYSNEGILAAEAADVHRFPVISPAATLDELFHHAYFRSLGISLGEQARHLTNWAIAAYGPSSEFHIVTQVDQIFSLRFSKIMKSLLAAKNIHFTESRYIGNESGYANRISAEINRGSSKFLFFSSYWNTAIPIIRQVALSGKIVLGNSEWVYNEDVLAAGLDIAGDVYMIADYAPSAFNSDSRFEGSPSLFKQRNEIQNFSEQFRREFSYTPTALVAGVYDTVELVCETLALKNPKSRDEFMMQFFPASPRVSYGLRGLYSISNQRVGRSVYLSKWDGKTFKTINEFMAWM